MKRLLVVTILAALCACHNPEANNASNDRNLMPPQEREANIHAALNKRTDDLLRLYESLKKEYDTLKLKHDALESDVARLQTDWARAIAAADKQSNKPPNPKDPPKQNPPAEDKTKSLVEAIAKLKQPLDPAAAQAVGDELKPLASEVTPRLMAEIRNNWTNLRFLENAKSALARFPQDALKDVLAEGLRDSKTRSLCAKVVGEIGDAGFSALLNEHVSTQEEEFREIVGEALVSCKRKEGVPLLVATLQSEVEDNRYLAITVLKRLKNGDKLGYEYALGPTSATNKQAIAQWEKWWDENQNVLFK